MLILPILCKFRFNPTGQTAWAESSANYDGVRHRRPIGIDLYELMGANPFGWAGVAAVGDLDHPASQVVEAAVDGRELGSVGAHRRAIEPAIASCDGLASNSVSEEAHRGRRTAVTVTAPVYPLLADPHPPVASPR